MNDLRQFNITIFIALFFLAEPYVFGNSVYVLEGKDFVQGASFIVVAKVEQIQDKQKSCKFLRTVTLSHQSFLKGSFPLKDIRPYILTVQHYPMAKGCSPPSYTSSPEADFEEGKLIILTLQGNPGLSQVTSSYNLDQLSKIKEWLRIRQRNPH